MYFVDSRTHATTVAYGTARQLGMRTVERDIFIDTENSAKTYDFAIKQLDKTAAKADRTGFALAIGHPYPGTLRALVDHMPDLNERGYRFVFASQVVEANHRF